MLDKIMLIGTAIINFQFVASIIADKENPRRVIITYADGSINSFELPEGKTLESYWL